MWSKEDSKNLASIAKSLEKIADRETERELLSSEDYDMNLFERIRKQIKSKEKEIKVTEGPSIEDEALEEDIRIQQRMQNKLSEASADSNMPFFAEALLDEEELESLR